MSLGFVHIETASGYRSENLSLPPTCMIVEDQVLIGLALEAYLEEVGLEAHEPLSSAAEALEWLGANRPTVAILDYSLKDGSCVALTRALRTRGIPFVIYSGHRRSTAPPELQDVAWLSKPCDRGALLAALTHAAPAVAERAMKAAA